MLPVIPNDAIDFYVPSIDAAAEVLPIKHAEVYQSIEAIQSLFNELDEWKPEFSFDYTAVAASLKPIDEAEGAFKAAYNMGEYAVLVPLKDFKGLEDKPYYMKELRMHRLVSQINHPNILKLISADVEGPEIAIVVELCPKELTREFQKILQSKELKEKYVYQIISAISAMNEAGIIHHDLHRGNVLINPKGDIKIIDFGNSRISSEKMESYRVRIGEIMQKRFSFCSSEYLDRIVTEMFGLPAMEKDRDFKCLRGLFKNMELSHSSVARKFTKKLDVFQNIEEMKAHSFFQKISSRYSQENLDPSAAAPASHS